MGQRIIPRRAAAHRVSGQREPLDLQRVRHAVDRRRELPRADLGIVDAANSVAPFPASTPNCGILLPTQVTYAIQYEYLE
jgi:hypothetical protein